MAKRHVTQYYLQMESQYFEMVENLRDLNEDVQKGIVSPEEYQMLQQEVEKLRENYERISYIMLLLNKPNRKTNEDADMNKKWYQYLKGSSKEALIDENKDALANLKQYLKNKKESNNG